MDAGRARDPSLRAEGGEANGQELPAESAGPKADPGYGPLKISRRGGAMIRDKWKPMYEFLASLPASSDTLKGWQVQEWLQHCWHELPGELTEMGEQKIVMYTLNTYFRLRQKEGQGQRQAREEYREEAGDEGAHDKAEASRSGAGRAARRGGSMIQDKWRPMYEWLERLPPSAETLKAWQVQEWLDRCWHELPKELTDMGAQKIIVYTLNSFFRLRQRSMQMEARRAAPPDAAAADGEGDEEADKEHGDGVLGRPRRRRRRTQEYLEGEDAEDAMRDFEHGAEEGAPRTGRMHRGVQAQEDSAGAGGVVPSRRRRRRMPQERQAQAEGEDLRLHLQRRKQLGAAVSLFNSLVLLHYRVQSTLPKAVDGEEVPDGEPSTDVDLPAKDRQGAGAADSGTAEHEVRQCQRDGQPTRKLWPSAVLKEGHQPTAETRNTVSDTERTEAGRLDGTVEASCEASENGRNGVNHEQAPELDVGDGGRPKGALGMEAELVGCGPVKTEREADVEAADRVRNDCSKQPAGETSGPQPTLMEVDEDDKALCAIPFEQASSKDAAPKAEAQVGVQGAEEEDVERSGGKDGDGHTDDEGDAEEGQEEHAGKGEELEGRGESDESSEERLEEDERDAVGAGEGDMQEGMQQGAVQRLLRTRCFPPNASPVPWPLFFGALPEAQNPLPLLIPRDFSTAGRQAAVGEGRGAAPHPPCDPSPAAPSSAPDSQADGEGVGPTGGASRAVPEPHSAGLPTGAAAREHIGQAEERMRAAGRGDGSWGAVAAEESGPTVHEGTGARDRNAPRRPDGRAVGTEEDAGLVGGEAEASWGEKPVTFRGPTLLAAPLGCSLASSSSVQPEPGALHHGQTGPAISATVPLEGSSPELSAVQAQSPVLVQVRSPTGSNSAGAQESVRQTRGAKPSSCSIMPWLGRREITGLGPLSTRVCAPLPPSRLPRAAVASGCQSALGLGLGVRPASLMGWGWGLELRHEGPASSVLRRHHYSTWHPAWAFYTSHFAAAPVGRNADNIVAQKVLDVRFRPFAAAPGAARTGSDSGAASVPSAGEPQGVGPGEISVFAGDGTAGQGQDEPHSSARTQEEMEAAAPAWGQLVCGCNEAPSELLALDLSSGAALPLRGHECQIQAVEYACAGAAVVSCGANVVKVWDADTGALRHTLGRVLSRTQFGSLPAPAGADLGQGRGREGRGGRGWGRGRSERVGATESTVPISSGDAAPASAPGLSAEEGAAGGAGDSTADRAVAGHWDKISALAVNAWDSRFVASSSAALDPRVLLWDVEDGSMQASLETGPGGVGAGPPIDVLRFADSVTLVGGSDCMRGREGSVLCVWDTHEGRAQGCMEAHDSYVTSLAIGPTSGGSTVLSCGGDGSVALYDVRSMRRSCAMADSPSLLPSGGRCEATSVGFSFCGTYFHASFNANCTLVWDKRFVSSAATLPKQAQGLTTLSRPLHLLSQGHPMPGVQHSAQHPGFVDFGDEGINDAKWFHRSPCLVTASGNGSVALWDVTAGQPLAEHFKAHSRAINSVDISEDDNSVASGGDDQKVVLYLREQGRAVSSNVRSSQWRLTHCLAG